MAKAKKNRPFSVKTFLTVLAPRGAAGQDRVQLHLDRHLSGEYINQRFGVQMTHVPYKISPQAIQDVAAGHVQLTFAEAAASLAPVWTQGSMDAPVRGVGGDGGPGLQRDILRIPHSHPRLGARGLCGWSINLICWVGGVCFVLTTLRGQSKISQNSSRTGLE